MPISRRGFLGYTAGVSAAGFAGAAGLVSLFPQTRRTRAAFALVDSGTSCTLRESVAGYEAALSSSGIAYQRTFLQSVSPARTMILPAAALMDEASLAAIRDHLESGSTVLFESGAGFSNSGEFHFHRRLIKSSFGLSLHAPIRLWDSTDSFKQSPYVDYQWPLVLKVRDFSRIVPVDCEGGEIIAWFQNLPVAAKRRVGKGTLVFLGTPLGPHLLSGDREAGSWLGAFCSSC